MLYGFKVARIYYDWLEIVQIGDTQKIITTIGFNNVGNAIVVTKFSRSEERLKGLYKALQLLHRAFIKIKSEEYVVHKPSPKNRN